MHIIAIFASVVGSQAIINRTFSIINQCQSFGCFPRVKVVHASDKMHGRLFGHISSLFISSFSILK